MSPALLSTLSTNLISFIHNKQRQNSQSRGGPDEIKRNQAASDKLIKEGRKEGSLVGQIMQTLLLLLAPVSGVNVQGHFVWRLLRRHLQDALQSSPCPLD